MQQRIHINGSISAIGNTHVFGRDYIKDAREASPNKLWRQQLLPRRNTYLSNRSQ